jgi:hypothetical protein
MQKDKKRDLARSVLPSTSRKSARENKRNLNQQHRTRTRQTLRSVAALVDYDEAPDQLIFDPYHARNVIPSIGWDGYDEIISNRRGHDKLGPIIRWAKTVEKRDMKGWSNEEKYAFFKRELPDSLQGRHALGHIESALGIYPDEFRYGRYRKVWPATDPEAFRAALRKILASNKTHLRYLDEVLRYYIPVTGHITTDVLSYRQSTQIKRDENGRPVVNFMNFTVYETIRVPVYRHAQCAACRWRDFDGMDIEGFVKFCFEDKDHDTAKIRNTTFTFAENL